MAKGNPEQRDYRITDSERAGSDVVLAIEYHAEKGNCARTRVQLLSLAEPDLADPSRPARHARLLAKVREDTPFSHWRTVAELAPLPAARLLEAMEAAEVAGESGLAARWWQASIPGIPPAEASALQAELAKRPGLTTTWETLKRMGGPDR